MAIETAVAAQKKKEKKNGDLKASKHQSAKHSVPYDSLSLALRVRVYMCSVYVRATTNVNRGSGKRFFLLKQYWRFECETDWIISTLT